MRGWVGRGRPVRALPRAGRPVTLVPFPPSPPRVGGGPGFRSPAGSARRSGGRGLPSRVAAHLRARGGGAGRGPGGNAALRRARWLARAGRPVAGPVSRASASPAAAWPPGLAAGCGEWSRRWCWWTPGCRFTAFISYGRCCVTLKHLTRVGGGRGVCFVLRNYVSIVLKNKLKAQVPAPCAVETV